ncbi:MAG: polysaccharide deacetylase family protein [Pseudomonadota bacterium]|nr:polysaccharide deacetylase family protein [Pseudomonadota bacterium]
MKQLSFRSICGRSPAAAAVVFFLAPVAAACPPKALGVARTLEVGTSGGLQVGLKTYPRSLALDDREIVLTFDDGPSAQTTPKVLDALAKECVKATFFLVGRNAEALPALVKREIAEGNTVGHHTFSHPAATLRGLSEIAAQEEILRGFEADDRSGYGTASSAPKVRFFRFPGFADTPALVAWLSAKNIAVFGADFWASDWVTMTPQAELALILSRLDKERRGILLLHDTKQQTAAMLPDLLQELKKRGYKIVNIVAGTNPAPTRAAPEGWTPETEKIIAAVFAKTHRAAKAHGPAGAATEPSGQGGNPSPK